MRETAEEQRKRLEKKRIAEATEPLIRCLECNMLFKRVGSHVIYVHGYSSASEYRKEHGLMLRETRTPAYAKHMAKKASTITNLEKGASNRFKTGGEHKEVVSKFWSNREQKLGTRKRHLDFGKKDNEENSNSV